MMMSNALAGANIASTVKIKSVYIVTLLKLFILPVVAFAILYLFRVDRLIAYALIVAAACPSATTGVAFALTFRKDHAYASQLFVFTTILSMVTIPLFVLLTEITGIW